MTKETKNNTTSEDFRSVIIEKWNSMETKADIVSLINVSLKDLYGEKAKQVTLRKLNYFAYSAINKKRYISFEIPKKDGSKRKIDAPCNGLRTIQRALNHVFQIVYTPHVAAMGFVPGRSVATNANIHVGQRYVYNIDLKDFFPSISSGRIFKRLQSKPFSLKVEVARIITDLCCYSNTEGKNVLPQGAPTSPTITNFICERLDVKLTRLANAYGLKYSRYADDITFSGMNDMFDKDGKFCQSLHHIIEEEEHFVINQRKTRLCHTGMRQEVTGVTVNQKANVSRRYVKQIRTLIHNWEKLGYEEAQTIFLSKYKNTKGHGFKGVHHIENIIAGKLLYMKMIKGDADSTYMRLVERFEIILKTCFSREKNHCKDAETNVVEDSKNISATTLSPILDEWEKNGMESALELFKQNMEYTSKSGSPNSKMANTNEMTGLPTGEDDEMIAYFDLDLDSPDEGTFEIDWDET